MGNKNRIRITPRARKLAEEKGIEIDNLNIEGTGFDGGISEKDLLTFIESGGSFEKNNNEKIKISPLAKKIAEEKNIDLSKIKGSGFGSKIMKKDVLAFDSEISEIKEEQIIAQEDLRSNGDKKITKKVPYDGIRRVIGERMCFSKYRRKKLTEYNVSYCWDP